MLTFIVLNSLLSRQRVPGIRKGQEARALKKLKVTHHRLSSVKPEDLHGPHLQVSLRKEIVDTMNTIKWKRVDVIIPAVNSHGRVIVRTRNYLSHMVESGMDIITHLADHFVF